MKGNFLWLTAAASVRGSGHVKLKLPNQDSFFLRTGTDGSVVAVVVSDGAGSAPQAERGSHVCSEIMGQVLLNLGENHAELIGGIFRGDSKAQQLLQEHIIKGLRHVRDHLDPTENTLHEFHHTFTGAVLTTSGGFVAQIGDSPGITAANPKKIKTAGNPDRVDFFADYNIHNAEKGEYANETCFVTQPTWRQNLQLTPIPAKSSLMLMSDGAGDLVMNRGKIFRPFISNVLSRILKEQNDSIRNRIVEESLSHSQADEVTADDKTLIIVCPRNWQSLAVFPCVEEDPSDHAVPLVSPPSLPLAGQRCQVSIRVTVLLALLAFVLGISVTFWEWHRVGDFLSKSLARKEASSKTEPQAANQGQSGSAEPLKVNPGATN